MRQRRALLFGLLLLVLVIVAPALAQDGPPDAEATAGALSIVPEPCAQPGSLVMWVWDAAWAKAIQPSIDDWTTTYCPGATVRLVQQPYADYWTLLQANATSGDLPDVFNMSQDRVGYYTGSGALLDLQPYWDRAGVDTAIWSRGEVDPYRYGKEGHLFAGPANWDTVALFYNRDMFDAAGIKYPTADWTWDDFADAAARLTDASKGQYGAAVYSEYQPGYANWIASTDTTPVVDAERTRCTLTDPGSLEALNFLKDLYDNHDMPGVSTLGGSSADNSFQFWLAGEVAMVSNGDWKLDEAFTKAPFNWGIAQLPENPTTGLSRPILHSVGYVASARTTNPDLAANLILYLVSDEGQQFFADGAGVAPANPNERLQQAWLDSFAARNPDDERNVRAFVDALADTQGVTAFGEIWNAINTDLVVDIFDHGMSVAGATEKACQTITPLLPS